MFDNRGRRVGDTEYVASGVDSLDLPRKALYRQLSLKVAGVNAMEETIVFFTAEKLDWDFQQHFQKKIKPKLH